MKLHLQANFQIMSELGPLRLSQVALAECLHGLHVEFIFRNIITDLADRVNFQTPYPLDPETAATVDTKIQHHVYTWENLIAGGYVRDWLWKYLMNKGEKELPIDAYSFPDDQHPPTINPGKENEVRACFSDDAKFELFRSGQDYTNNLASVTDAEYNRHYD
jgi:hypothetical protein